MKVVHNSLKFIFDEQMGQIKEAKADLEKMFLKAKKLLEGMYWEVPYCSKLKTQNLK